MNFHHRILMIGFGSVARCTLPLLLKHVNIPLDYITIIDGKDKRDELASWTRRGVHFRQVQITPGNLSQVLSDQVSSGDLILDLSLNIDGADIITWCNRHDVLYINASVEVWDPYAGEENGFPYEKTLHSRHMRLQERTAGWSDAPTCIVDHGANPGLISHFAKRGLVDIADRMIREGIAPDPDRFRSLIANRRYAELAMEIGVRVIHCSEQDTQVTRQERGRDEFVNTWSVEGFFEEAVAPAELGWGTHETTPPEHSYPPPDGHPNVLVLRQMGMNTWIRSYLPDQEITGMVIRHGESFGMSDRWTVWDGERAVYRPTVSYVYHPCEAALASLARVRENQYRFPEEMRILERNDIISGSDTLGALLMGHPYRSWWTGSILSIEDADSLVPGQNATTIQVGIGMVAAVMWLIANPREGFCLPDDLPYDVILNTALPYLGEFRSEPAEWSPVTNPGEGDAAWQFEEFIARLHP